MAHRYPVDVGELDKPTLTHLLRTMEKSARVADFTVKGGHFFGDGENKVSTAGRGEIELALVGQPTRRAIIKLCRPDIALQPLYRNEVAFYTRVRPSLEQEIPQVLGADFDEDTGTFGLILEDLREREASFPNVTTPVSLNQLRALIDQVARLHARFWQSPELLDCTGQIQSHVDGELFRFFMAPESVPALVRSELTSEQFKREMLEWTGSSEPELYDAVRRVQQHQSTLPFTLCHGDCHIGNTYLLPGDRGGLLDWQLTARGYGMHDIAYLIITGLSVSDRRLHEHELIHFYLQQLAAYGIAIPPDETDAWYEYRLAANWCLYIGWLTTPKTHYGWEITVCNVLRLSAAVSDLGSVALAQNLPDAPPVR